MSHRVAPEEHPLVYVADATVHALDRETGQTRWKYESDKRFVRMLLAYDCVYVLDVDCVVHCVRAEDGHVLGKVTTGTSAIGAAMLSEPESKRIYIATTDGVYAITPDGRRRWTFQSPAPSDAEALPGLGLPGEISQPDFRG